MILSNGRTMDNIMLQIDRDCIINFVFLVRGLVLSASALSILMWVFVCVVCPRFGFECVQFSNSNQSSALLLYLVRTTLLLYLAVC